MKRQITSIILALCLCLGLVSTAFAAENTADKDRLTDADYMALVILNNSNVKVTPTDAYKILDVSGNDSYTCVEFDVSSGAKGFGIIDLSTYDVVMYALDATVPFTRTDTIVYNGYLRFATINQDNTATILDSNTEIAKDELYDTSRNGLTLATESMKAEKIQRESGLAEATYARSSEVLVSGGSDTSLVYSAGNNSSPWTTDCGINAVAMYLRHMDNYFNNNYVQYTHNTEQKLKVALAVIANDQFGSTTSISMSNLAKLANKYMDTHSGSGVSSVSKTSYTWTKYKNRINNGNGHPCILYIGAGATSYWTKAHAVVGVGYTSGATSSSGYDIVNSGWTSLGYVRIATSVPGSMIKQLKAGDTIRLIILNVRKHLPERSAYKAANLFRLAAFLCPSLSFQ